MKTYKVIAIEHGRIVGEIGGNFSCKEAKNMIERIKVQKLKFDFVSEESECVYAFIEEEIEKPKKTYLIIERMDGGKDYVCNNKLEEIEVDYFETEIIDEIELKSDNEMVEVKTIAFEMFKRIDEDDVYFRLERR